MPLITNWPLVIGAYLGLVDLRAGRVLRLANGLRFTVTHYVDAWTILQVVGRNDYGVRSREDWRVVLDVGANIGTFSVLAARAAPGARIYSYEPGEDTCGLLRANLALNGVASRVRVHQQALAGRAGPVALFVPAPTALRSTQVGRAGPGDPSTTVEAVTLARAFEDNGLDRCDVLKMDCEGAEYEILAACPDDLFARIARIALEFHEWGGAHHRQLVEILEGHAFGVTSVYDELDHDTGYIFAVRDGRGALGRG
jgi:FkbM family methyltransferase